MEENTVYIRSTDQRTITNHNGHEVNVSLNVLRHGLVLLSSTAMASVGLMATIAEEVISDRKIKGRVIAFHDDARNQGFADNGNKFPVLNVGGLIAGGTLDPDEGELAANYALDNPGISIFIDLSTFEDGEAARFIADFVRTYGIGKMIRDLMHFDLFIYSAMNRSIPRKRDHIGDTRAVHTTMRFQGLANTRNIGILNMVNSLNEIPKEFVTNCPNIAICRITDPEHQRQLRLRVPDEHFARIMMCVDDQDYGINYCPDGVATFYPRSDMPLAIGFPMPFILKAKKSKTKIGNDPRDPKNPKGNQHLKDFGNFIAAERQRIADEKKKIREAEMIQKAKNAAEEKAIRKKAEEEAMREHGLLPEAKNLRKPRVAVANDNGRKKRVNLSGTPLAIERVYEAGIKNAPMLVNYATRTMNSRNGKLNLPLLSTITWERVAKRVISDAHLRTAINIGIAMSKRDSFADGSAMSGHAYCTAYYQALCEDEELARQFHYDMFVEGDRTGERNPQGVMLENALKQLGYEPNAKMRSEAQYQHIRAAWEIYRTSNTKSVRKAA